MENIARVMGRFISPGRQARWVDKFMGGNFSVRREVALTLGEYDERFVRVCYHFEAEFAYRLIRAGHRIFYEPAACVHHLRASSGGTRVGMATGATAPITRWEPTTTPYAQD